MYNYSQKMFQKNTAKIKMRCKDFLRMRDKISQLYFQGTRKNGISRNLRREGLMIT